MPDLLALLAVPNRRRLLELLGAGERSAGELASAFTVTRPAISQHLRLLVEAGLVTVRREGRFRYYRLDPAGMAGLRRTLQQFWAEELDELVRTGHDRKEPSLTPLEQSVVVPLDANATFALITEPERLRRWKAVSARLELQAGGSYRFTVAPGHTAFGTVTEVEPGRLLEYTWAWEEDGALQPGNSTVRITLEPADGGTRVRLVHSGLTEEQAAGHGEGWIHYLDRLVAAATEGDAGADPWAAAPDPIDELRSAEATLAHCERMLRDLGPAELAAKTPCPAYDVAGLVDHLLDSLRQLAAAAGGAVTPRAGAPAEIRVAEAARETLEAWRARGLEGSVRLGPGELPAALAASILSVEFLVHAWDVSAATGRPLVVDDRLSGYVLGLAGKLVPAERDGERFAPEVIAPADADVLSRLAAFTGRAV